MSKHKVTSFTAPWPPAIYQRIVTDPQGTRWLQFRDRYRPHKAFSVIRLSLDRPAVPAESWK